MTQEMLFNLATLKNLSDQYPMKKSAQEICASKTALALENLKSFGLTTISRDMICECSTSLSDAHSLSKALSQADHLEHLWRTLEQWKTSIAVTYNPLMTATGYFYQGHDFGWVPADESVSPGAGELACRSGLGFVEKKMYQHQSDKGFVESNV
jgi:hypothetical protein